jgi:hypothetical protein
MEPKIHLYYQIADLLLQARKITVRAINQTMVYTYYEIGRMIVEDEQQGAHRAEYGKQVLKELSAQLTRDFGKGFSEDNLSRMKNFYILYSSQISATSLRKLQVPDNEKIKIPQMLSKEFPLVPKFHLSWSHYLKLMRIENKEERNFYEIESINNNWSLRELQRQFDSALYERLVLSRDKERVKELSMKGQIIESPKDAIKNPFVLEFLGQLIESKSF